MPTCIASRDEIAGIKRGRLRHRLRSRILLLGCRGGCHLANYTCGLRKSCDLREVNAQRRKGLLCDWRQGRDFRLNRAVQEFFSHDMSDRNSESTQPVNCCQRLGWRWWRPGLPVITVAGMVMSSLIEGP
jgi:hypothetical protein